MTQRAAICMALLKGEVLSIMTGFKRFNCSNIPREISRSVEIPFQVRVSRIRKEFVSTYGQPGTFMEYRLNRVPDNAEGIKLMELYIQEVIGEDFKPKVKHGAKRKHILEPQPNTTIKTGVTKQTDLFSNI